MNGLCKCRIVDNGPVTPGKTVVLTLQLCPTHGRAPAMVELLTDFVTAYEQPNEADGELGIAVLVPKVREILREIKEAK